MKRNEQTNGRANWRRRNQCTKLQNVSTINPNKANNHFTSCIRVYVYHLRYVRLRKIMAVRNSFNKQNCTFDQFPNYFERNMFKDVLKSIYIVHHLYSPPYISPIYYCIETVIEENGATICCPIYPVCKLALCIPNSVDTNGPSVCEYVYVQCMLRHSAIQTKNRFGSRRPNNTLNFWLLAGWP